MVLPMNMLVSISNQNDNTCAISLVNLNRRQDCLIVDEAVGTGLATRFHARLTMSEAEIHKPSKVLEGRNKTQEGRHCSMGARCRTTRVQATRTQLVN